MRRRATVEIQVESRDSPRKPGSAWKTRQKISWQTSWASASGSPARRESDQTSAEKRRTSSCCAAPSPAAQRRASSRSRVLSESGSPAASPAIQRGSAGARRRLDARAAAAQQVDVGQLKLLVEGLPAFPCARAAGHPVCQKSQTDQPRDQAPTPASSTL